MKKFYNSLKYIFVFSFLIFCIFHFKKDSFLKIPVNFGKFGDQPLIDVSLEGQKISLLVDIGSCHDLGLQSSVIQNLKSKQFIKDMTLRDGKGDAYPVKTFLVPEIAIESAKYEQLVAHEETPHYFLNAGLLSDHSFSRNRRQEQAKAIQGKIGRPFFSRWACLFDFPRSVLMLAETSAPFLQRYSSKEFVKIPFMLSKQGISIFLETNLGKKEFLLDTGANVSLFRESQIDKTSAQEVYPGQWNYTMTALQSNQSELGPWPFRLYEFCSEIPFDGVLGVDFFKAHSIIIDFSQQALYIADF